MLELILKGIGDAAEPMPMGENKVGRMLTLTTPFRDLQVRVHELLGDIYVADDNSRDAVREYKEAEFKLPPGNRMANDRTAAERLNKKLEELEQHRKGLGIAS